MNKKPIDIKAVRQAHQNLDRIAREHPHLVDPARAQWSEKDVAEVITSNLDPEKEKR